MAPVSFIAITASGCIGFGVLWVAAIFAFVEGRAGGSMVGGALCMPGLIAVLLGAALAVINGFVAVLT